MLIHTICVSVYSAASTSAALQVMAYMPTRDGKQIRDGMTVRVAPATVRKEEFGTMLGAVSEVSDFPATPEGMQAVLQNQVLVSRFSRQGAPYPIRVDFVTDAQTRTGYAWTSGRGPDLTITAGTTVMLDVTVREVPPIAMVMPFLARGLSH